MANYAVEPDMLYPWLPDKTELDDWKGNYYISLVGFLFSNVRVKGMKIPFHVNFPEVNLRFYVRYKDGKEWKRGVVFIKEIVPKPAISLIANTLFHERYSTMPMKHESEDESGILNVNYQWKKNKKWNLLGVSAETVHSSLQEGTEEEFITEHFWGYSRISANKTGEYHVQHPRWNIHKVISHRIDCNFADVYGDRFNSLSSQVPGSVFLADGSAISVFTKTVI